MKNPDPAIPQSDSIQQGRRSVIGPVVDDQKLEILECLGKDACNGTLQSRMRIPYTHDNGNAGQNVHYGCERDSSLSTATRALDPNPLSLLELARRNPSVNAHGGDFSANYGSSCND